MQDLADERLFTTKTIFQMVEFTKTRHLRYTMRDAPRRDRGQLNFTLVFGIRASFDDCVSDVAPTAFLFSSVIDHRLPITS